MPALATAPEGRGAVSKRADDMSSHISSRREYVVAKLAVRNLRRTIRDLRERLLVETNPIDYYSALADAATAEAQLDDFCVQIGEWELCGASRNAA